MSEDIYTPAQQTLNAQINWVEGKLPKLSRYMQQEVVGELSDLMIQDVKTLTEKEVISWIKSCRSVYDKVCAWMDENNVPYVKSLVSKYHQK